MSRTIKAGDCVRDICPNRYPKPLGVGKVVKVTGAAHDPVADMVWRDQEFRTFTPLCDLEIITIHEHDFAETNQ